MNNLFKIENMRSIEDLAKAQLRSFRLLFYGFLGILIIVILGGFYIISSNKDRVYVFDGTYGVKKVERVEDKAWYFSASYAKLLFEGTKYTFDTTVTVAYNYSEKNAQDYIKALVNAKFYETASAENAQLLCYIDSVKIRGYQPVVTDVYMSNYRINQFGKVQKNTVVELVIGTAKFTEKNPFGMKVQNISLVRDEVVAAPSGATASN